MKHEELINNTYKDETKHSLWYIFWCAISGLTSGYCIYKIADHMEKSGYWRGIRTATQWFDKNENNN